MLRKIAKKLSDRTPLNEKQIRLWAERTIDTKGYPWSETEFNAHNSQIRHCLSKEGATEEQLALYDKLVKDAPIRGGAFNRWSGDLKIRNRKEDEMSCDNPACYRCFPNHDDYSAKDFIEMERRAIKPPCDRPSVPAPKPPKISESENLDRMVKEKYGTPGISGR